MYPINHRSFIRFKRVELMIFLLVVGALAPVNTVISDTQLFDIVDL